MRKNLMYFVAALLVLLCIGLIACESGSPAQTAEEAQTSEYIPGESSAAETSADETSGADTLPCGTSELTEETSAPAVTEQATEPDTEPVTEAITEARTEAATEPVTEPVTVPATEPHTEPVTEPATEPVTEPVTEPITEARTEAVTEPVTEPVTVPATEPLTEPVTEPATEPVTEPVVTEPVQTDPPEAEHVHVFGEWKQTAAPTCTSAGEEERECVCGEKEKRPLPQIAHSFVQKKTDAEYLVKSCSGQHAKEYYYSCECGAKGSGTFSDGKAFASAFILGDSFADGTKTLTRTCPVCAYSESASYKTPGKEYTFLEFLESDGGQYVNTGITMKDGMRFAAVQTLYYGNETYYGTQKLTSPEKGSPIYLFYTSQAEKEGLLAAHARVYSAMVCDPDGSILAVLLPVKRLNGEHGFYNAVSGKFISASGTGSLRGPDNASAITEHKYTSKLVIAPSGASEGLLRLTCAECGAKFDQRIPKLNTGRYVLLEYVESTGTQWTDLKLSLSGGAVVFWEGAQDHLSGSGVMVGAYDKNGKGNCAWLNYSKNYNLSKGTSSSAIKLTYTYGAKYSASYSTLPYGYASFNGKMVISLDEAASNGTSSFNLFTTAYDVDISRTSPGRLYYAAIYNSDGVLQRLMLPVYDKQSGNVGFLDTKGGKFYGNDGKGEYVPGEYLTDISGYEAISFLGFDENSYIDTAIYGKAVWTYDIEFIKTGDTQRFATTGATWWGINSSGFYFTGSGAGKTKADGRTEIVFDTNKRQMTVGGSETLTMPSNSITADTTFIGMRAYYRTAPSLAKLYALSCTQSGKLVRDFIPVRRLSDGKEGLYDKVSGKFFPLVRTHVFEAANDFTLDPTDEFSLRTANIAAKLADAGYHIDTDYTYYIELGYRIIDQQYSYDADDKNYVPYNPDLDDPMIDTSPYTLLCRNYFKDGELYYEYLLSIRGTAGNEWYSNTKISAAEGELHPGFEGAADWILKQILPQLSEDKAHNVILVTGHSRGAAVGAILASKLIDSGKYFDREKIFAYVFACPKYSRRNVTYPQIHIINNAGDFVTGIPLAEWGFHYEGSEYVLPTDSATMSRMDTKLKTIQRARKAQPKGYLGGTDCDDFLGFARVLMPTADYLLNPANRKLLAEIFDMLFSGKVSSSIMSDIMAFVSSEQGNKEKLKFAAYMLQNSDRLVAGHEMNTYLAWIQSVQ